MYKEGKAAIRYRRGSFLNPEGIESRDISTAFVATIAGKNTKVLDATAATGIRGMRYYLETQSKEVTLLEMNKTAFSSMSKNLKFNKVKAKAYGKSIQEFANTTDLKFDVIDLDPFGGVTPYIYDLMKVARSGTYMLITATDTAVLCGADYKACLRLYDARPMHNEICKDVGLRLLAGYVARVAAQFNFGIRVLVAFSYLHYMRIIVQLRHGSKQAIDSMRSLGYVDYCGKCLYRGIDNKVLPYSSKCPVCGSQLEVSGKVWVGGMSDRKTLESVKEAILASGNCSKSSIRFVDLLSRELDIPLFYSVARITKSMKLGSASVSSLIGRLESTGFKASKTHLSGQGIRTNANIETVKSEILHVLQDRKKISKDI